MGEKLSITEKRTKMKVTSTLAGDEVRTCKQYEQTRKYFNDSRTSKEDTIDNDFWLIVKFCYD